MWCLTFMKTSWICLKRTKSKADGKMDLQKNADVAVFVGTNADKHYV